MLLFYTPPTHRLGIYGHKMKKIFSSFLITLFLLSMCSCTAKNQTLFFPETVKYNIHRSDSQNEFSFNMNMISFVKNPKIEFLSAAGVNTEQLAVTFSDDTFMSLKSKKINGYFVTLLGVHCKSICEYTKIDAFTLLVDGKETEVNFEVPIENTFISNTEHCLSQRNMPVYVFPQSFVGGNETDYTFSLTAITSTTVNSFAFNEFLDFFDSEVYVNESFLGNIPQAFPLTLKKNEILTVKSKIKLRNEDLTGKENFYLNLCVECECGEKEITEYYPLTATFIGNVEDAKEFIEFVSE